MNDSPFEQIQANARARLTITVVGYGFGPEWHVIINSLLMQRRTTSRAQQGNPSPPTEPEDRWVAQLINDGPDPEARAICERYVEAHPDQLAYAETGRRFNDWGHTLRGLGMADTRTELWATQNADNYLMPMYVQAVLDGFDQRLQTPFGLQPPQVVIFPCVHNYANVNNQQDPPYSVLDVSLARNRCDAGSFVLPTALAQDIGWFSLASDSDGDFLTELARRRARTVTLRNVLMVHN